MKKILLKITCVLLCSICLLLNKSIYAASFNISGASSGSPGAIVNVSIGGNFTGRINVTVSNGSGNTSLWIENSTATVPITLGSSGTTTISATANEGASDSNGNEIKVSFTPKTISIVQPTVSTPTNNNNTSSNTASSTTKTSAKSSTTTTSSTAQKSNNAYLKTLQVNQEGLTPNFNKSKTSYSITVGENINSLNITATPEDSTAKAVVSGNTGLKNGDNKVYVTVTASDGTKKVYTITVTKTGDPVKANSYLESLIVENATLSPEFSKENLEYDCGTVGASVENLKILAFGENENVKIDITGNDTLVDGENTITVKVTSEDGTTTKEYVIKVIKDPNLVEEQKFEEINPLQDTNNDNKIVAFLKDAWQRIKANWLIVLMYIVILVEFVQIVYLYKHRDFKNKKNIKKDADKNLNLKNEVNNKVSNTKNLSLDKEFKINKKMNNNTMLEDVTKKRLGAEKFNIDDKNK